MDSNPPPAPANACATLSLCWDAAAELSETFCACSLGSALDGSGFEGVGALTLSDMMTKTRL